MRRLILLSALFPLLSSLALAADKGKPIPIAEVKHEGPVDFEKEVLPILRRKCLACHNATEKESDLVLETPQTILKGGSEGPAVVAGKGAESLLIKLSSRETDPVMPPDGNDVKAKPLTSEELGLIKLWIDQGAKGTVLGTAAPLVWQPLPAGVSPIYAVAVSPDGQYAAAGRANQIYLYHVPSKREVGRLTDPNLLKGGIYTNPGVAHLDLVQSLQFSPDNELLASGGYREVKLWKRARNAHKADLAGLEGAPKTLAVSRDGKFAAIGEETGKIKLFDLTMNKVVQNLAGHTAAVSGVCFSADGTKLLSGSQDKTFRVWTTADGKQAGIHIETPAPVNAVAFVAEDKQIATGNADNTIRLWDLPPAVAAAEPARPLKELKGHTGPVTSLAIVLPTGVELVSGSQDGTARVWNVTTAAQTKIMTHGGPIDAIAVRADGTRIASVSSNNSAKLWNAANSQMVAELKGDFRAKIKVDDETRAVALSKRNIDAAKKDLDEATKRKTAEEENQKKAAEAVKKAEEDFTKKTEAAKQPVADKEVADKALVDATAAKTKADEAKKLTDAEVPKLTEALTKAQAASTAATKAAADAAAAVKTADTNKTTATTAAKQAADAAKVALDKAAAAKDAAAKDAANKGLADAAAAAQKASDDAAAAAKAAAEKQTAAEQALVVEQGKAKVADEAKVAADKVTAEADAKKKAGDEAKKKADTEATAAQTAFNAADQKVKALAPTVQKVVDEKNAAERTFKAGQRSVERAAESVKAATDALPALDAAVKAQEEITKQKEAGLEVAKKAATDSEKPLKSIAFSPDGLLLATAGDDQMVHTWDAETGAAVESYSGQGATVLALGYTADKNVISAAQNNTIVVWDTNPEWTLQRVIGGVEVADAFADRVTALAFSADSKQLATGGGEPSRSGEMKIWNVENGQLVQAFKEPHSDTIFGIEFSPDGKFLASCGADRFVKIFEVAGAKFVRSFEGHTHHVLGVSWRADGRLLASGGADNVIKVWDVKTGDQARTIQGFAKEVTSIRFVADGDTIIASGGDNSVRLKNAANGGNVRDLAGATDFMYAAAASGDGKIYVAGGQDSALRIWKEDGVSVAVFAPPKPEAAPAPPATK